MEFVRLLAGFTFSCVAFAFSPLCADAGVDLPESGAPESTTERIILAGAGDANAVTSPTGSILSTQTITLTQAGITPPTLTVYVGTPVEWLNQMPVTAHLHSGLPQNAYLPFAMRTSSGIVAADSPAFVGELLPLMAEDSFTATIPTGNRYSRTFTVPYEYDYYVSEMLTQSGHLSVIALSNLAIQSVVVNPRPASLNSAVTITTMVVNTGPGPALPFNVTWQATPLWWPNLSALYSGTWSVAGLPTGASITLTATQVVTQPGALSLVITADAQAAVPESNETDNTGQAEMGVLGTFEFCGNGNMTADAIWAYAVFVPDCDITIQSGATLTVRDTAVIKPRYQTGFFVYGNLAGTGDPGAPVVFTSYKDDAYGGDTNGDPSPPTLTDWDRIYAYPSGRVNLAWARLRYGGYATAAMVATGGGVITLDHVVAEFGLGGGRGNGGAMIVTDSQFSNNYSWGLYLYNTTLTVTNSSFISTTAGPGVYATGGSLAIGDSSFRWNASNGLNANGGSLVVTGNIFQENKANGLNANSIVQPLIYGNTILSNTGFAIGLSENSNALTTGQISTNTMAGNGVNGVEVDGTVNGASRLVNVPGVVYVMGGLNVAGDGQLVVDPGDVVKFTTQQGLFVYGTLTATGTSTQTVVFTSLNDDAYGGATNGSPSIPTSSDWDRIYAYPSGQVNLAWARLRYGGYATAAMVATGGGVITLDHVVAELGLGGGRGNGGAMIITDSQFSNNYSWGLYLYNTTLTVTNSSFISTTAGPGIYATGGSLAIGDSSFRWNASNGLNANGGSLMVTGNIFQENKANGLNANSIVQPLIYGNTILSNTGFAIGLSENSNALTTGQISTNTMAGNGVNGVEVDGTVNGASRLVNVPGVVYVVGGLNVAGDGQLVVDPGDVVKFTTQQGLWVYGTLTATGTSTQTVVFTSLNDDAYGGATNGSPSIPTSSDWDRIYAYPSGRVNLAWARLRYGGYARAAMVETGGGVITLDHVVAEFGLGGGRGNGGAMIVTDSQFSNNYSWGLYLYNTTLTVTNSSFISTTAGPGIYATGGSLAIGDSSFRWNASNGLNANGGSLVVTGNIFQENKANGLNANSIVQPLIYGNTILSNTGFAIGLSENSNALTTGQISTNTMAGNGVNGVEVDGTVNGASRLVNVPGVVYVIGGLNVASDGQLVVDPGDVVKFTTQQGLWVYGTLTATGTSTQTVVFTSLNDDAYGGATNGSPSIPTSSDWDRIYAYPSGQVNLAWARLRYGGYARAAMVETGGGVITLDHVVAEFGLGGGRGNGGAMIITDSQFSNNYSWGLYLNNTAVTVTNSSFISTTAGPGVYATGGSLMVSGSTFYTNTTAGVLLDGASASSKVLTSTFSGNAIGVQFNGSISPTIGNNSFAGNTSWGVLNNAAFTIDARSNWWGSASGPTNASNPGGAGDNVSDGVLFNPFLTSAP